MKATLDIARKKCPNIIGTKFTDTDFGELGLMAKAGYNVLAGFGNDLL